MIPQAYITEWSTEVPWQTDEQVEQDLLISRTLCEIFSDDFLAGKLAFRGGTALHKIYLSPQPRYSEDIDLVQIDGEPIKPVIRRLRECLAFAGVAGFKQKRNNNTLTLRTAAESDPSFIIRLKIEINCREHFSEMGLTTVPYHVNSSWFTGSCDITTYYLEELIGTKMRALYQRKKGRDLYDIHKALISDVSMNEQKVINCYHRYMAFSEGKSPTKKQFKLNLGKKITDDEFTGDITALLRSGEEPDWQAAFDLVTERLIDKI